MQPIFLSFLYIHFYFGVEICGNVMGRVGLPPIHDLLLICQYLLEFYEWNGKIWPHGKTSLFCNVVSLGS